MVESPRVSFILYFRKISGPRVISDLPSAKGIPCPVISESLFLLTACLHYSNIATRCYSIVIEDRRM
jgi:hypothetical protein